MFGLQRGSDGEGLYDWAIPMPLHQNAIHLIQANLEEVAKGNKVRPVVIGELTERQLGAINQARHARKLPVVIAEVLFFGKHIYQSRIVQDGYTIEDVLDQIVSAMSTEAEFIPTSKAAAIQNHAMRLDRYGNMVQDLAVFECTARHPRPELFSVTPNEDTPPNAKDR